MTNKLFYILYFIIFTLIFIPIVNFLRDDYGVFGLRYANLYSTDIMPNEQYLKLKFLTNKENKKYNNFIFGVSQAQVINSKSFVDSENWYNISGMSFSIYEYIDTLEYLKKHNVKVKKICMLLQINTAVAKRQDALDDKNKYFMLTGFPFKKSEVPKFYANYLFMYPSAENEKNYRADYLYKINLFKDGSFSDKTDLLKKVIKHESNFENEEKHYSVVNDDCVEFFSTVKDIINYCNQNNIELKIFLSPDSVAFRKEMSEKDIAFVKQHLAKYTDYYDFANINEITENPENYISYDHFNAYIGSLIIKRIYYEDKDTPPVISGFGEYVYKTD